MTAETLNQKIEEMAKRKAEQHVQRMRQAITAAAEQTGHGIRSGDGTWFGETFRAVLLIWVENNKSRDEKPMPKSPEMIDYYRAEVLREILEKLPLIKELVSMEENQ